MLKSIGSGYIDDVNVSITNEGNWYMRFYLVDEAGGRWLCKALNKEKHQWFNVGDRIYITEAIWRKCEGKKGVYSYLEIEEMHWYIDESGRRQKEALRIANANKS